ncbi:UNVERIFIED_CONTAM: hypothetical protein PYX00_006298 [Menopon gallinae]|uniref:Small ribosomal subunit protein mS25 n=1 Tax=Menopon gallinae TaxID=328185 RepID=A0AAW2HUV2_9NEOP
MPFMVGKEPIRRTLGYLKNCKIHFRENVRIFCISFDRLSKHHEGARDFIFWHLPQVQFNNPTVQCIKLKDFTPTPFIKIYFDDKEPVLIDIDSRTKDEIREHLENFTSILKAPKEITGERSKKKPLSLFGYDCIRQCICEIEGQVPCSAIVPVPKHWRGIQPKERKLDIPPHILMNLNKELRKETKEE